MCWLTNGSFLSLLSYLGFGGFVANGIKFWGYHFCKLLTLYVNVLSFPNVFSLFHIGVLSDFCPREERLPR